MAGVNYTSVFLGFEDGGFKGEDLTTSPLRPYVDNIPLPDRVEVGENSFTSFDSEAGYGEKVADYNEELLKLASVSFHKVAFEDSPQAINYVYDDSSSTPLVSPAKPSDIRTDSGDSAFKAFNIETLLETPQVRSEIAVADVHSPVSASKFIERSLHDLDDLINQRRLELSELKRSNRERLGEVPEYTNPLHHTNYKRLQSPPLSSGAEKFSSPLITIPRATYDGIRDEERSANQQLKAEQAKVKRLEALVQELEGQCAMHSEKAKTVTAERNRMANSKAQVDEEAIALTDEIAFLNDQLQLRSSRILVLEKAVSGQQNGTALEGKNGDSHTGENRHESSMAPEDLEKMLYQFDQLEQEVILLRRRCEEADTAPNEWADRVSQLEQIRKTLEEEKTAANGVAYQWQSEAGHFERELAHREELLLSAQEDMNEIEKKMGEMEDCVAERDERIEGFMIRATEGEQREREMKREREEMERDMLTQLSKKSHLGAAQEGPETPKKEGAPLGPPLTPPSLATPAPMTEDQLYGSFWSDDHLFESRSPVAPSSALSKQSLSASLAKRVLITWDRTPVRGESSREREKNGAAKKGGMVVGHATFLMLLAFFQVTIWFLLLLASYFYFADFNSCRAERFRYTH